MTKTIKNNGLSSFCKDCYIAKKFKKCFMWWVGKSNCESKVINEEEFLQQNRLRYNDKF